MDTAGGAFGRPLLRSEGPPEPRDRVSSGSTPRGRAVDLSVNLAPQHKLELRLNKPGFTARARKSYVASKE